MTEPTTIVACLTPAGAGAIATLAIRGPRAWPVACQLFRSATNKALPAEVPESGSMWFGHFGEHRRADQVILSIKEVSPVPWVEVHCHGGRQLVGLLLETLDRRGIERRTWQEFLRAVQSPLCAAALEMLAQATTTRAASILLDQYHGALEQRLDELRLSLLQRDIEAAWRTLDELQKNSLLGRHLVEPWRVVVAGAPNVGKSTLVNALAGYRRSIVAPSPGTTRDVLTTSLAIDGWPIELMDTAGLRDATASLESAGIALARQSLVDADLCLWIVDTTTSPVWPDPSLTSPKTSMILVVNKIDQPPAWNRTLAAEALFISATTGAGLPELCSAISQRLVPSPPSPGCAVPFLNSQFEALAAIRERIDVNDYAGALQLLQSFS